MQLPFHSGQKYMQIQVDTAAVVYSIASIPTSLFLSLSSKHEIPLSLSLS